MDEVIFREFHGRVTREERERLLAWRGASRENEEHHAELWRLLGDTFSVAATQLPGDPPPLDVVTEGAPAAARVRERVRFPSWRSRALRIATAIAAGIAVLIAANALASLQSERGLLLGTDEVVTGASEMTTVKLGDGTIVRLAPSSRLRVSPDSRTREVWLEGRAYFAVAKFAGMPFRVRTHAGDAVVLGTRFDLEAREDNLELLVVEGAVNVAAGGESLDVEASQAATATRDSAPRVESVDPTYVQEELRWLGDFLVFENTPLGQAARELTAHFGVPVEVLDTTFAQQTVSGMFVEQSLDAVVKQLCQALSAYCSVLPTGVTISP